MPPVSAGLRNILSNKSLDMKAESEDMPLRMKAIEEKVDVMRQQFEAGIGVEAAFAAGRIPSGEEHLARPGFYRAQSGFSDGYAEALMANLTALDGLDAGDLARRLDRMDAMLQELLSLMVLGQGQARPSPCPQIVTSFGSPRSSPAPALAGPASPPQDLTPCQPSQPPPPLSPSASMSMSGPIVGALRSVKEETSMDLGRLREKEMVEGVITPEDMKPHSGGKTFEVVLERDPSTQPSWGLLWDRKSFNKKSRVLEAVVPQTPAGLWNQERSQVGEEHLQKGDELVKLDGQDGWEACNQLPNLQKVQLVFHRPDQAERKGRRSSKGSLRGDVSMQASLRKQRQNVMSTSSTGSGGSRAQGTSPPPHTPQTPLDLSRTMGEPPRPGRGDVRSEGDTSALIQVLKDNFVSLEGQLERRDAQDMQDSEVSPSSRVTQDTSLMVERIMEHSAGRQQAGKPNLTSVIQANNFRELSTLATLIVKKEELPAIQHVSSLMAKNSRGGEPGSAEVTEAAEFLLDLLTFLKAKAQDDQPRAPLPRP